MRSRWTRRECLTTPSYSRLPSLSTSLCHHLNMISDTWWPSKTQNCSLVLLRNRPNPLSQGQPQDIDCQFLLRTMMSRHSVVPQKLRWWQRRSLHWSSIWEGLPQLLPPKGLPRTSNLQNYPKVFPSSNVWQLERPCPKGWFTRTTEA